jgi:hypothetical protein
VILLAAVPLARSHLMVARAQTKLEKTATTTNPSNPRSQSPDPQTRERKLFLNGQDVTQKTAGLEVKVLKSAAGTWKLVDPRRETFMECDQFKVQFWSNAQGHVYFVNITPGNEARVIYHKRINKGEEYTLPDDTAADYRTKYDQDCVGKMPKGAKETARENFIYLDDEVGTETLKLVMTPQPIAEFDKVLEALEGQLTAEVVAPPAGGAVANGPCFRGLKVKCRSVGFDPPNLKKGTGTFVVARPDPKDIQNTPLMKDGEAIVFELRLQHVKRP